jgi:hypothetical protein
MSEGFGRDTPLRSFLQTVVADCRRRIQPFLGVARIQFDATGSETTGL